MITDNTIKDLQERIYSAEEKVRSALEAKKKAEQVWAERGEKYDVLALELGNRVADFLKDYVSKVWPTVREALGRTNEKAFNVYILEGRKFGCSQAYFSFVSNGDLPIIWYYLGDRSYSEDPKINVSPDILNGDKSEVQYLGSRFLCEKSFFENRVYSKWDKGVDNVPELPREKEFQDLYEEITNCLLSNTAERLEQLIVDSSRIK